MLGRIVKILKITALCIVAALIVAALLYYVPWSTPVDLTLNAVKLDENGNEIGTAEIHIKGHKLDYLFRDSRLDVEIEPFDSLSRFKLSGSQNGTGSIHTYYFDNRLRDVYAFLYDEKTKGYKHLLITFTDEMDRFVLRVMGSDDGDDVFYVASASGKYDTQGILDYFNSIVRGLVPER